MPREAFHRFRHWLREEIDDARRQAFQIIAAVASLFLLVALMVELLFKTTDAKVVAALVPSLLASAFLACFGKEVAGRIKTRGPSAGSTISMKS
jgi:hypothetical protein